MHNSRTRLPSSTRAKELSVVIVSWNVRDLLVACIHSVYRSMGGQNCEVIVVDNASTDGSCEAVEAAFPGVRIIRNDRNLGFAAATNQGIRQSRGEAILLLNPDTVVLDDAIRIMMDRLTDPRVGIVGPKLIGEMGELLPVCARPLPRPWDYFWYHLFLGRLLSSTRFFGGLFMTYWDHEDSREVEALCGACMLVRRDVFERLGELDDSHSMYLEDIEYCHRTRSAGLKNVYVADAKVVHLDGRSSSQAPVGSMLLMLEALRQYMSRYQGRSSALMFRLLIAAAQLVRIPGALLLVAAAMLKAPDRVRPMRALVLREAYVLAWATGILPRSSRYLSVGTFVPADGSMIS